MNGRELRFGTRNSPLCPCIPGFEPIQKARSRPSSPFLLGRPVEDETPVKPPLQCLEYRSVDGVELDDTADDNGGEPCREADLRMTPWYGVAAAGLPMVMVNM